jgi:hypothetical protein
MTATKHESVGDSITVDGVFEVAAICSWPTTSSNVRGGTPGHHLIHPSLPENALGAQAKKLAHRFA